MLRKTGQLGTEYNTEHDFKKELESSLWCYFDDTLWSKVKPKKALPWYGSDMSLVLSRIMRY
jgi:hypothetical protein